LFWRPVFCGVDTQTNVSDNWTMTELFTFHALQDAIDDANARARERAEREAKRAAK
jgi:hypothetical protein